MCGTLIKQSVVNYISSVNIGSFKCVDKSCCRHTQCTCTIAPRMMRLIERRRTCNGFARVHLSSGRVSEAEGGDMMAPIICSVAAGNDRLKEALHAVGLKAGGTMRQRAERLMLLRGTTLEQLDRKHFAPGAVPAVRTFLHYHQPIPFSTPLPSLSDSIYSLLQFWSNA